MALLLPLLLLLPIVEMYLLIRLGGYLGAWPTIAMVVLGAVSGIALLRRQGPAALNRVISRMQTGEVPALELAEGALLAAAGLMLLMPGFLTDILALLLLVPVCRAGAARWLIGRLARPGMRGRVHSVVIEGEFERRSPDDPVEKLDDRS